MKVIIEFTEPVFESQGRGWLPGGTGGVFPFEVVSAREDEYTLVLKEPTWLRCEDRVVTLMWESPGRTIGVSVHVSRIRELTLRHP